MSLPYGVFRRGAENAIGVAIGDRILDLRRGVAAGLFDSLPPETRRACSGETLNALMALTPLHWHALRARLSELVRSSDVEPYLVPMQDVEMLLPVDIGDYTDFYASIFHATNVGKLFRPDNPLLPNYKHIPIGYHGRASSIVVSGTPIRRPNGQTQVSTFGPTRALDYELEVGFFIGGGNALGEPIPIESAEEHVFGVCLVNDWSARDIQAWEYQPLGPFLGKSFATSISPWVVPMEALAPYRAPLYARPAGDPAPLEYLDSAENRARGAIDITLEVEITTRTDARGRGGAVSLESREFQRALLVDCADGDAPYEQRLQSSSGRSAGQRYGFGTGARFARMSAGNGSRSRCRLARFASFLRTATRSLCAGTAKTLTSASARAESSKRDRPGGLSYAKRPGRRLSVSPKRSNFTPMRSIIDR